jgi:hypothetical protein
MYEAISLHRAPVANIFVTQILGHLRAALVTPAILFATRLLHRVSAWRCVSAPRAAAPDLGATLPARRLDALIRRFMIALTPGIGAAGSRPRAMCRDAVKHSFDADVLVDIRPVHTLTGPDQVKILALLGRGFR